jgi:hypothetical protein
LVLNSGMGISPSDDGANAGEDSGGVVEFVSSVN